MEPATKLFREKFSSNPAHSIHAPGRLELLGNHTDYNQGLVLSLAVDKFIHMVCAPRADGRVELVSTAFDERENFSLSDVWKNPATPWADYVKGVIDQLRRRDIYVGGFNAAIHGTVPMGAGMSSSAALEVATALAIRELYPYTVTGTGRTIPPKRDSRGHLPGPKPDERLALAKVCQAAENQFVGVQCGLLDQISSLFGKAFHAIEIDCLHLEVNHVPMIGEIAVLICNSGVKHSLVGGEYNELRRHCESAARKLGIPALRSITPPELAAKKQLLTEREYNCAAHVVGEIQRVIFGERALREDDFGQFGQYMFQSHASSKDLFGNSTPELDLLVDLARKHPACMGARLTGGGFGGATINLIDRNGIDSFSQHMATHYRKESGHEMAPMLCQVVDGAGAKETGRGSQRE